VTWRLAPKVSDVERRAFANAEQTFKHRGGLINDSKTNFTQRVEVDGRFYYVKRYLRPGKYLRRYFGWSRVSKEWRNAGWFSKNQISTPRQIAMGEGNRWFGRYWGVIVSEEASQTIDLRNIYQSHPELLGNRCWRIGMLHALAKVVGLMHGKRFIHNDLQWRNLLVSISAPTRIYMIDCPAGRSIYLLGNRRGVVRDLAFLDKMASVALSNTDRLRFYLKYRRIDRLRGRDKKEIGRILSFLENSSRQKGIWKND
jgi:tRNA A-37 threonylcarbamoyl transferase component Bud32